MLFELQIRDLAIIEDLSVEFGPGLNVLSGETGAGKSIILGALGLILGNRASAGMVRTGSSAAEVQARFDRTPSVTSALDKLGIAYSSEDDGLLIRRVVTEAGRSRAWLGDTSVPLSSLRALAPLLVDYASQQEHRVLLDEAVHGRLLDDFGDLGERLRAVGQAVGAYRSLLVRRAELQKENAEREARDDFVRFQLSELEELGFQEGEWERLEVERRLLRDAESLLEVAQQGEQALYGGANAAVEQLTVGLRAARRLAEVDPQLSPLVAELQTALVAAEEAGRDLGTYARGLHQAPPRLDAVEARLAEARRLSRKHRCSADELVEIQGRLEDEALALSSLSSELDGLADQLQQARQDARQCAEALRDSRKAAALELGGRVKNELKSLGLPKARFVVSVEPLENSVGAVGLGEAGAEPFATQGGCDRVAFLMSSNVGEDLRPLAGTASGGELSRIVLALHQSLSGNSGVQVCVFDEIDAGIGGVTAEAVGRKLVAIAQVSQVLCITHLPQLAAGADHHFRVEKRVDGGRTRTQVVQLEAQARVEELVRMVAGTGRTDAAETFAQELLDRLAAERSQVGPSRSASGPATLTRNVQDGSAPSSKGASR